MSEPKAFESSSKGHIMGVKIKHSIIKVARRKDIKVSQVEEDEGSNIGVLRHREVE